MKTTFYILPFISFIYSINAQIVNIPDTNFEQALIDQGIDSEGTLDGQVLISDINTVENLIIFDKGILDLTGIQYFSNLKILNCSDNPLNVLDLSMNTALEELYAESKYMTKN